MTATAPRSPAAVRRAVLGSRVVAGTGNTWEQLLLDRIVAGDDSALEAAYDQFGGVVYGLAARIVGNVEAADICQEVFVTLWNQAERVDVGRGSLRAFLVTVARRRCIDHLRKQGRRTANEERAVRADPAPAPDVGEAALAMIAGQRVRDAMKALPPAQRIAIQLAYFEGLTFRQVAEATGASEGTAKSRIRLGLGRLSTLIGRDGEMESR